MTNENAGWNTAEDLVQMGYRREAIEDFFGEPTEGPNGIVGWTETELCALEDLVINPAHSLLQKLFTDPSEYAPRAG